MRKLVVLVFVFGLVMLMPRVGEAVALTGQCGWCGGVCRIQTMGQVCTDVVPPKNLVCMEEKGMCVVKGENDVAVPTIKYAKEGEKCSGVSVVCESGLECNDRDNSAVVGGICVKTKCLPRPLCLDAIPPCMMPELESYCPKMTEAPMPTLIPTGEVILGDANEDGVVDLVDFAVWKNEYLTTIGLTADFNKDEKVDLIDFSIWKVAYLTK